MLAGANAAAAVTPVDRELLADNALLRRFWPIGESVFNKPSRPIFKPVKYLCQPTAELSSAELFESLERLKRRGVLTEMNKNNMITINMEALPQTQQIFEAFQ